MTDLVLTEDSQQYQDLAKDFSQNEIAPRAEAFDHSGELPTQIWKKAWDIGLVNVRVPEEFAGLGLRLVDSAVIAEELGAGCVSISSAFWANDLAVAPLLDSGSKAQQQKYLEPLLSEFSLAGYCFEAGSTVTADRSGSNTTLNGSAIALNATSAPWFLVTVSTVNGATAFIVPRDWSGLKVGPAAPRLGFKCADLCHVQFDKVSLPEEQVLAATAPGATGNQSSAIITAAYATGLARCAMQHAIKYSKERVTFGQPIANHQAVGFMLADMAKNIEAARLLTHKAAWLADQGEGCMQQSLTARHFATEIAMTGATDAVQVFGGYGYSREYPVEKLMRDAKMLQVYGSNAVQSKLARGAELIAAATMK